MNWKIIGKAILGWFLTLIMVGGTTALFVDIGIYSRTVVSS